ncbi:MAG: hypothetical protein PHX58_04115, partial [Desulfovibrio sp.]|nr:hypothetical protein [Desulfovibrio sp.]
CRRSGFTAQSLLEACPRARESASGKRDSKGPRALWPPEALPFVFGLQAIVLAHGLINNHVRYSDDLTGRELPF